MPVKYSITERAFPSYPAAKELRSTYDRLRYCAVGNNRSAGLQLANRDRLIDQLHKQLSAMRLQLREASQGELAALQRIDVLISQIEEDAKVWELMETAGDDLSSGIWFYKNGKRNFSGGSPISRLVGACYRFVTAWRTAKDLRKQRNDGILLNELDSPSGQAAEGGDQAERDAARPSAGQPGSGTLDLIIDARSTEDEARGTLKPLVRPSADPLPSSPPQADKDLA